MMAPLRNTTSQICHPERSEGSEIKQNAGDFSLRSDDMKSVLEVLVTIRTQDLNTKPVLHFIIKFIFFLSLLMLTACGTSEVTLAVSAQGHLNQDASKNSLPVLVRIYTLSSSERFNSASFRQLWLNDKQILGNSLVTRQELIVDPHSHLTINITHDNTAEYLAIVAVFRHPKHDSWRLIRPMPSRFISSLHSIAVQLSGSSVQFL